MGWWRAGEDGSSLHSEETGLAWGDSVADILDNALDEIKDEFLQFWGRKPLRAELEAGLQFALGGYEGDGDPEQRGALPGDPDPEHLLYDPREQGETPWQQN